MADGNYNGNGQYEQTYDQAQPGSGDAGGDKIKASRNDDDERKIFVGGLSWETSEQEMKEYFQKFGDVVDCTLKTDPHTGRSRGFGFVLFTDASTVDAVISAESHTLHGRTIDPKKAKARGGREPIKKIFVGGLDPDLSEADIKQHFEQFGKVEEVVLPYDKVKNQRRAFGFITFESEEIVDMACVKSKQTIGQKEVDVRKATPKTDQGGFGGRGGGRGGGGGFGGRGGYGGGYGGRGGGRGGYDQSGYGGGGYDYYGQGYGSGYDYSQGYGGTGGYDYNSYYGQGWGGYGGGNQGYGGGGYGSGSGGGYSGTQQNKQFGSKRGGGGYHPYSR